MNSVTSIYQDYLNGYLIKKSAVFQIQILIENYGNWEDRLICLQELKKIDLKSKKSFKIFEYCLLSDEDERIRMLCADVLIKNFQPKDFYEPLDWLVRKEESAKVLIIFLNLLNFRIRFFNDSKARTFKNDLTWRVADKFRPQRLKVREGLWLGILIRLIEKENIQFTINGGRVKKIELFGIKRLDLSDFSEIIMCVKHFTSLDELVINDCDVSSINVMGFNNLKLLSIKYCGLSSIKGLESLTQLEYLDLRQNTQELKKSVKQLDYFSKL